MIILAYKYGDHSNRLIQNMCFEAFCKEHGIEYINPSFSDMHKYYANPCKLIRGFRGILLVNRLYSRGMRWLKRLNIVKKLVDVSFDDENSISNMDLLFRQKDIYVGGWYFRVHDLTAKYQEYIISKYSLKNYYYEDNSLLNIISESQNNSKIVIGIHIRRGDYQYFEDGKWYYSDNVYMKYMKNIEIEIEKEYNKKCVFIIFSNDDTLIEESENIYKSKNEWYVDHFLMSKCDLLIGAPSTFTKWASYMGKVKYFHMLNDSGEIHLENFIYFRG